MKSLKNISGLALLLLFAGSISACNVLIAYDYYASGTGVVDLSPEFVYRILVESGFETDTVVMGQDGPPYPPPPRIWASPVGYDIACYWLMGDADLRILQDWVFAGGKLILIGEQWIFPTNTILNAILSDSSWSATIGKPQLQISPISGDFGNTSTIEEGMYLPNSVFRCVDSIFTTVHLAGSAILLEDSSECDSCGILMKLDSTHTFEDTPYPVLGTFSRFGNGMIYVFGDAFLLANALWWPGVLSCNNDQFVRDLFRCSPPLEDAWLGVERYRVILNLEGDTSGIVWDSIYVTFNEDSFYTVNLDWDYYPSGIDFNAVGDTGYAWVCVVRIPGPTGESLLPCGPICDSLWLEPAGITETLQPNGLAISIHPNPFNSSCRIYAPYGGAIEIFDVTGRKIIELPKNEYIWRPSECVSSGIYLIQVKNGMNSVSKRVLYIK